MSHATWKTTWCPSNSWTSLWKGTWSKWAAGTWWSRKRWRKWRPWWRISSASKLQRSKSTQPWRSGEQNMSVVSKRACFFISSSRWDFTLRLFSVSPQQHVDRCLAEESRRGLSGPPEDDRRLAELQPSTERHEIQHQQHRSEHALAPKQPRSWSAEDRHVQRDVLWPDAAGAWSLVETVNGFPRLPDLLCCRPEVSDNNVL